MMQQFQDISQIDSYRIHRFKGYLPLFIKASMITNYIDY